VADQEQPEQQKPPIPQVENVRDPEDFAALYANNVQGEASVWDMKVIFGILDQSSQPNKVVQHTSINLPWIQIKLLAYLMRANLAFHEAQNGKVFIPASILPPNPETLDFGKITPELRESLNKIYADFLATL